MTSRLSEIVETYELALTIIANHGHEIASEEAEQIAAKALSEDHNWLVSWEAPE